ncbi:hypothetical protein AB0K80_02235 [Streptomyces sp. NPDC052682]|uniref:hypothetical protein n=1 Tax=Streptomyces sp. NPDC052682 TaxID=3154954 RepID=UPI003435F58D
MAAPAHLPPQAPSKRRADTSVESRMARPAALRVDGSAPPETPHFCVFSAEGTCVEAPLTSEPPLPDAEPLTSEPPLFDAAPLTSEPPAAIPDFTRP